MSPSVRNNKLSSASNSNFLLTLSFLLIINLTLTLALPKSKPCHHHHQSPPDWGMDYYVEGTLNLPYAEIKEPFKAWISTNSSRIDYYGGTMKTIQRADLQLSFKVNPFSNGKVLNEIDCFKIEGATTVQPMLPDLKGFKFAGVEDMKGIKVEKWINHTYYGKYVRNTYTFYASEGPNSVPVRYDMMGYDSLLGSHFDHYFLIYEKFLKGHVDPTVFNPLGVTPPPKGGCHGFPGPGVADLHLEQHSHHNPMREFVSQDDSHVHHLFKRFVKKHNKDYKTDQEFVERKNNFKHSVRYVHSKNRAGLSFFLAVNHFADKSDKEIKLILGLKRTPGFHGGKTYVMPKGGVTGSLIGSNGSQIPDEWDWRLQGAVTQVKDQAVCGSCWSFGTTGTIEGKIFLETGIRVRLSQQFLVDCSWGEGNDGCDGGEDFRAYKYIEKQGIPTETEYGPYKGINGFCKTNFSQMYHLSSWVNIQGGDLDALKVAIYEEGPISVGIDASHRSFAFYNHGVYYEPACSSVNLDHAVLAVGYGEIQGHKYWLVKNSWSTYWGNDGYILMSQKDNNCGVATAATFVVLKQ